MKKFLFIFLCLFCIKAFSQTDTIPPKLDTQEDYMTFVYKNLQYPVLAAENGIKGRVDFSFQVTSKGCIDSIKIINSPDQLLSNEVIRVLNEMKCKWIPGTVDSKPMRVTFSSYIIFVLE